MKYRILFILAVFSILIENSYSQSAYETIMDNVRANEWSQWGTGMDANATTYMGNLRSDGSWPDLNYETTSAFPSGTHLKRVDKLATAYTHSESIHYQNNNVFLAIEKALQYWDVKDPQSTNWWHNEIWSPQNLGVIMIVLRAGAKQISVTLENNLITQINRGNPSSQTGANKLDIAMHYIYRGALTANEETLNVGVTEAFQPIVLTAADEGLQHDFSYRQHGPQLALFSYGAVFLKGEVYVASIVEGTIYALSSSKINLLSDFARKVILNIHRGRYTDFSATGRGISRKNGTDGKSLVLTLERLITFDPDHADEYNEAIARFQEVQPARFQAGTGHNQFWRSDFALHNRPGYSFSVRTSSTRTEKTENGNGENLKGLYLSDGGNCIRVNGNEYYNIFPCWDWSKVPGVTVPDIASFPLPASWGNPGQSIFTGGVSDSIYGTLAYSQSEFNQENSSRLCLGV